MLSFMKKRQAKKIAKLKEKYMIDEYSLYGPDGKIHATTDVRIQALADKVHRNRVEAKKQGIL